MMNIMIIVLSQDLISLWPSTQSLARQRHRDPSRRSRNTWIGQRWTGMRQQIRLGENWNKTPKYIGVFSSNSQSMGSGNTGSPQYIKGIGTSAACNCSMGSLLKHIVLQQLAVLKSESPAGQVLWVSYYCS